MEINRRENVVQTENDAKNFSLKKLGINFTFKLFSTAEYFQPEEIRKMITSEDAF